MQYENTYTIADIYDMPITQMMFYTCVYAVLCKYININIYYTSCMCSPFFP